jgi:plasmid stabilization system protein ParE
MVYKIVWTLKALQTYAGNMEYLEKKWTAKEVKNFALMVEKKLLILSNQPTIGSPKK